ncbi:MAG: LPS export ABC transporter periplasmic protein LptC [Deltaproteobacteria bacterium]|nr:LPS export ABC transporter periplasmic protein LptC [Deltaproteobacteria bacterium]
MGLKAVNRLFFKNMALIFGVLFLSALGLFLILHYINVKRRFLNLSIPAGYISLKEIDYKFFKGGILTYEIFSKSLNYSSPKKDIIKLNGVKTYIYGKNKKPAYIITGKYGRLNAASKNVTVSGGVIIRDIKGQYVKAKLMYYSAKDDKITVPGYTKIKGKNYYVSGSGLVFYIKKMIFILHKDVHFISYGGSK